MQTSRSSKLKITSFFLWHFLLLFFNFAYSQTRPATLEHLEEVINCDDHNEGATFYLLDIWATWCPPCIAQFPHINELKEKAKHLPLEIIAVTNQSKEKALNFLNSKGIELNTCIGFDYNSSLIDDFSIENIPYAILIYPDGRTKEITSLDKINSRHLEMLLKGKEGLVDEELRREIILPQGSHSLQMAPGSDAISQGLSSNKRDSLLIIKGAANLKRLISFCFKIEYERILLDKDLAEKVFEVNFCVPNYPYKNDNFKIIKDFILHSLNIDIQPTIMERKTVVLKFWNGNITMDTCSFKKGFTTNITETNIEADCVSLDILALQIEEILDQPTVNETGTTNKFSYSINYKEKSLDGLKHALEKQEGLTLISELRNQKFYRVIAGQSIFRN